MPEKPDTTTIGGRIRWLAEKVWGGAQNRMADEVGVSPAAISNAIRGKRRVGRELLMAIGSHPLVRLEWLLTGEGQPLAILEPSPEPSGCSLPLAKQLFVGKPEDNLHVLSGEQYGVAEHLRRQSRYWYRLPDKTPRRVLKELTAEANDLMLVESDTAYWGGEKLSALGGRPCVVSVVQGESQETCLGLIPQQLKDERAKGLVRVRVFPSGGRPFYHFVNLREEKDVSVGKEKRVIEIDSDDETQPEKVTEGGQLDEPQAEKSVNVVAVAIQIVRSFSG